MTRSRDERVRDTATYNQAIDDSRQRIEHRQFCRNLRTTDDGNERPGRIVECLGEGVEFRSEQRPGTRDSGMFGDAVCARLRAMRRSECIHDEYVAECGHLLRQRLVAGFLTGEETHVFQQYDLPGLNVDAVDPVVDQRHLPVEKSRQLVRHGPQ